MKIALIGHGKTGKVIEEVIKESNRHEIVSIVDKTSGFDEVGVANADVVIDFSSPEAVMDNIEKVAGMRKNLVVGTTGWYDRLKEVEKIVEENKVGLIYGQNFSIGANIFFKTISYLASLTSRFGDYDAYGLDIHHKWKKDSPSGTAIKIMKEINKEIKPKEIHFSSISAGRNPGMHKVVFDSEADEIILEVSNHNRRGYAEGALKAAEFIEKKKGIFAFDELFK